MAILEAMQAERFANCDFVFSRTGNSPMAGFGALKNQIDKQIDKLIEDGNGEAIAPWTFHDLRRSGASKMPRLGVSESVIEKLLNHTTGTFKGIVGVYQRHKYTDEKLAALEVWAGFLERLASGADNVVRLAGNLT